MKNELSDWEIFKTKMKDPVNAAFIIISAISGIVDFVIITGQLFGLIPEKGTLDIISRILPVVILVGFIVWFYLRGIGEFAKSIAYIIEYKPTKKDKSSKK